ncbi:TerB family tellurite resistance protein [Actinospica sp.]|uniref:TerB family tellurite resistance protein n=1 Tax=Actinospica sp. TaxID=1872142 RepID=UPI002CA1F5B5|nr:TerB family tellurite resistance protein [Actinospica sp.]HWG23566.1 TerB family tellurite resistance protein [Actinospica sp.]
MFFLFWQIKVLYRVLDSGTFLCPQCGADRAYKHRVGRRWFTLYFIPLFPVSGRVNEHVRCDTCQGMFTMGVLARPTSAQLSGQLLDGVRGLIVHVLRAGSMLVPEARATAVHEVRGAGLPGFTDQSLAADLDVVPGDLSGLMGALGGQLADQGKENLLRAGARTALADGPLTDLERRVLTSTAAELGMTPAHAQGLIAMVEQSAPRR